MFFFFHSIALNIYLVYCIQQVKSSKKLIGTDDKSNISNFKYTNLVEICPLCKDDLLYLPAKLARQLGNISRLVIVKNISNLIHLIDPLSGQTATMIPEVFWRDPIRPIITGARSRLTRYIVLGKEPVVIQQNVSKKFVTRKQRNRLATVTLAKESDLGVNDNICEERSHLGYLMKAGDVCLGYDLTDTQLVEDEAEEMRADGKLPDVIIVRKLYGGVASGDVNAAKSVRETEEKQPLTNSPFIREFEYGANNKGYWSYKHMVLQIGDCIDVMHALYPDYNVLFLFDHSCGHDRQREDGLNVENMSKNYGGKQSLLRPTLIREEAGYRG